MADSLNNFMLLFFSLAGNWETKVSNREKKQQRRKDRGPEDSGSPGGLQAPKGNVETPAATARVNTKKNRGNAGIHQRHEHLARIQCCQASPRIIV